MSKEFGVQIDYETADRILVCALKEHYEYIKKDIEEVDEMPLNSVTESQALYHSKYHSKNLQTFAAMKIVLAYFGETL